MLMRKHKFKGRELLECLKRIQLRTFTAGELIVRDSKELEGFHIILDGQCSKHVGLAGRLGKAIKEKIYHSATQKVLDDEYPRFLARKVNRLDSMDFSPVTMLRDINEAIGKEVLGKRKRLSSHALTKNVSEAHEDPQPVKLQPGANRARSISFRHSLTHFEPNHLELDLSDRKQANDLQPIEEDKTIKEEAASGAGSQRKRLDSAKNSLRTDDGLSQEILINASIS